MIKSGLDDLDFTGLEALLKSENERRTLEFKRDPVGAKDDDKREFLADVSSFANSTGGDLLFGVAEENGVPTNTDGIEIPNPDAEILRLEQILNSSLEPRIPRIQIKWVPKSDKRGFLIIRVPRSWAAPHRITFRGWSKFFSRNSAGKYELDVGELRAAFSSSDNLIQNIRRFRTERISVVEADEAPVPLRDSAKLILHIIPQSAFIAPATLDLDVRNSLLHPLGGSGGFNIRHTLEGIASYSGHEQMPGSIYSYTLLFRSGMIEAVSCVGYADQSGPFVAPESIEWDIITVFESYCQKLATLSVEPPYYVFLSFVGVRDHRLALQRPVFVPKFRRDVLLLPELVVEDVTRGAEKTLQPLFNLFWNAFGFEKSFSFDADGKYIGHRH